MARPLGLLWGIPARALGRDGAVAPRERILMAAIGLGGRGACDLGAVLVGPDVQWGAVCDLMKPKCEAARDTANFRYGKRDCAVVRHPVAERVDAGVVFIAICHWWSAWPPAFVDDSSGARCSISAWRRVIAKPTGCACGPSDR